MNKNLVEKDFQHNFIDELVKIGYVNYLSNEYNSNYAMFKKALFEFLNKTQPEKMERLRKIYGERTEDVIIGFINSEETKPGGSRLKVLKKGITIEGVHLILLYNKPASTYNNELVRLYFSNILSVSEEVWASDKE